MNETDAVELLLFGALGLGVGSLHFLTLWWNVQAYASPRAGGWPWALHGGRVLVTAALFCWLAASGAPALLCGLAGFLLARPIITRWVVRST